MGSPEKKSLKAAAKQAKKEAKAQVKRAAAPDAPVEPAPAAKPAQTSEPAAPAAPSRPGPSDGASAGVRYAEIVRGVLYLVLGASLAIALILGQRGAIISLEDIIDSLFAARAGKIVLGLIALALVIYGLKHLRFVR